MRKPNDACADAVAKNAQKTTENQPENASTAFCKLLGQLVAKRWVMLNEAKSKKNGIEADLDIDTIQEKTEHYARFARNE